MTATKMIRPLTFLCLTALAGVTFGDDVRPSVEQPVRSQLQQRAAKLRGEIRQAAESFERHLNDVAQSEETAEFVTQLNWPQVKREIEKPSPDLLVLRSYSKRLYEPFGPVELQKAIQLRDALDQYTDISRVLLLRDIEAEIHRRQAAVRDLLAADRRLDTVRLGEHLDWLELVGHTQPLPEVALRHNQPNIAVDIPKTVVIERIKQFNQEVTQSQYVSNVVAGTPISGFAYTSGSATAQLLPDESTAGFRIHLRGTINAPNNVAVQDPVVVYTSGLTTFSANKQVVWDGSKLSWGPTSISCQTQAAITGVAVTRQPLLPLRGRPGPINRVIERAAWRRAEQQRPQGEAAASRLAESRVSESFNSQVSELVGKLNGQLDEYVTRPLQQTGMMPSIDAVIKPDAICVSLLRNGAGGLAGNRRPSWKTNKDEFALHLHESALTNFMRASAGGAVWTDRRFAELQRAVIGTNSYELRIGLHKRWQVTLDWTRPLATRFDKGRVTIQVNVESLTIEKDAYRYPFSVEATYQFDTRPPSLGFLRVGDLRFKWTGEVPADAAQENMLVGFVREKFGGFMLDELHLDGLKVPSGTGFWGSLGGYHPGGANADAGWMLVTFREEKSE